MVHLTRRFRLSAAHRLHNEALGEAENARLYGKCNNPRGHGHDYQIEVTVSGEVDPRTGMVMDLGLLDGVVKREVLDRFDHMHLNLDVDNFHARVPTTENLCMEIYGLLAGSLAAAEGSSPARARLKRVRVEETRNNFFEYEGEGEPRGGAES